jgi:hypothetical protein
LLARQLGILLLQRRDFLLKRIDTIFVQHAHGLDGVLKLSKIGCGRRRRCSLGEAGLCQHKSGNKT